jgi:hypothetical protein
VKIVKPYQKVKLLTNRHISYGIKAGDIGVILADYDGTNFEVEFSSEDGTTIALFAFPKDELEVVE